MKRTELAGRKSNESGIWIRTMKPRFAICIDNSEYPASLELHKIYRVLPDEDAERDGDLRVVDESGEDYLYLAAYFVLVEVPEEAEPILIDSFARGLQPA
jgi:hypothetical protein